MARAVAQAPECIENFGVGVNIELARTVLSSIAKQGVRELVVCSGARNSPFLFALEKARGVKTLRASVLFGQLLG